MYYLALCRGECSKAAVVKNKDQDRSVRMRICWFESWLVAHKDLPRGYKTFFMLNSIKHEIFPADKC